MPERINQVVVAQSTALPNGFIVRSLREEDIPKLMKLRRDLGVHDVASCIQTWSTIDPEGIRIVETESGEIIGACSATKQSEDLYFVGLYCIREEYRGFRMGIQVWNVCNDHIGSANAALNAVPGKMELYRDKSGFPIEETDFKCIKNFTTEPVNPKHLSDELPQGVTIEPFNRSHLPHIFAYDFALVGFRREKAIEMSCLEKNSRTFVAFKNGVCVGFGTIKTSCLDAGRVGPLYADDSAVAEVLLRSLVISLPFVSCFAMWTVSTNIPAKRFLKKLDCPQMEELTRLYRKEKMSVDTSKVFALFDLNFGPF